MLGCTPLADLSCHCSVYVPVVSLNDCLDCKSKLHHVCQQLGIVIATFNCPPAVFQKISTDVHGAHHDTSATSRSVLGCTSID